MRGFLGSKLIGVDFFCCSVCCLGGRAAPRFCSNVFAMNVAGVARLGSGAALHELHGFFVTEGLFPIASFVDNR